VNDEDDIVWAELVDDGLDFVKLVPVGRTVRRGPVRNAPAQEVRRHDPASRVM
jgi:hypothetical protein